MQTRLLICVLVLACGCASKPKPPTPQIHAAVAERISNYSAAWFAGDATGVTESFTQRTDDEKDFAQALGLLAAAQKALIRVQPTVPQSIASTVQMSDAVPMITLNRPWHYYAFVASQAPGQMIHEKDVVIVQLTKPGSLSLSLRDINGNWLIEPSGFAGDRPVTVLTDSIRRQLSLTSSATEAITAKDFERLRVVLQQMNQQRMVDRISDSTNYQIP
jgi:hypothetical protein